MYALTVYDTMQQTKLPHCPILHRTLNCNESIDMQSISEDICRDLFIGSILS